MLLCCVLQLCSVTNTSSSPSHLAVLDLPSSSRCCDIPPPLPSRKSLSMQSLSPPPLPPRPLPPTSNTHNTVQLERQLLSHIMPPTTGHGIPYSVSSLIALVTVKKESKNLSKEEKRKKRFTFSTILSANKQGLQFIITEFIIRGVSTVETFFFLILIKKQIFVLDTIIVIRDDNDRQSYLYFLFIYVQLINSFIFLFLFLFTFCIFFNFIHIMSN